MQTSLDNLTEKITNSGVFKLSEQSTPIGIKCLTSGGKTISGRENNFIPYNVGKLRQMISEISFEMMKYSRPANEKNLLESLLADFDNELNSLLSGFDNELNSFFDGWGISAEDLNLKLDELKKKSRKYLIKQLSKQAASIDKLDMKKTNRRDSMIFNIHNSFKKHTSFTATDINYYIAHIMIECEVENGTLQTVFNKIDRAYYRYPKSPQMQ